MSPMSTFSFTSVLASVFVFVLLSGSVYAGSSASHYRSCRFPITNDGFLLPRETDAIDITTFNTRVAKNLYTALIKGRPLAETRVVNVMQKFSDVSDDDRIQYFAKGNFENGTCAGFLSSEPLINFTLASRNRMVFNVEGDQGNLFYIISSDPGSYYWAVVCNSYQRGSRRCPDDAFFADLYIFTSMAGTVMPFDLERAGRDLRQATCLRTNQNLGRFGYYYATGQELILGQGSSGTPGTGVQPARRPIPVPATSPQTCSPIQRITNIDCDTSSSGPVRSGAVRMTCPQSARCMRDAATGYAFCCWEESSIVSSPCENPLMRAGGRDFHECSTMSPCPTPQCYRCQALGRDTGTGLCCPTFAAGCPVPGTGGGTGVGLAGIGSGGTFAPTGAGVVRFGGRVFGTGDDVGRMAGGIVGMGPGILAPSGSFMPGGVSGVIPAGIRTGGVVPTGVVVPTGGVVATGGSVPTVGTIPIGGAGYIYTDPRFGGIRRGPMMMGAMGGVCPGGTPPVGFCLIPYRRCSPLLPSTCVPAGGGRGICCTLYRRGLAIPRRMFR